MIEQTFKEWFDNNFRDPDGGTTGLPSWLPDDLQLAWDAGHAAGSRTGAPSALPAGVMSVQDALRDCTCPRPMNSEPDDLTVGDCVAKGQCGCQNGVALKHAHSAATSAGPVAWIAFAGHGNIRIWTDDPARAEREKARGMDMRAFTLAELVALSAKSADTTLLDTLKDQSWDLRCFDIPCGDDADIGWRVVGHWQAKPQERTVGEVYHDDPRAAIREAIAADAQARNHGQGGGPRS